MENTSPVFWLTLSKILDNPYQPRQYYAVDHILNLAHSIASLKVQFRDAILESLFQRQQRWNAAYNESVATAEDIEALLNCLKGETVKAKEEDEEEEDDNAWYAEEEEDEAEAIPEF